jgi:hypothetical protein
MIEVPEWKPIHAAVLLTKYFNLPAIAFIASALMRDNISPKILWIRDSK